jgi:hypothetical protein
VTGFASQPFWLAWRDARGGRERSHAPDFFARLADGTGLVVDCRPVGRRDERSLESFAVMRQACEAAGWVYRLVGELDPVRAANLRWLAGYRHRRYGEPPGAAEAAAAAFTVPGPLVAQAASAGDPVEILPPAATPKMLAVEFARFIGLPLPSRFSQVEVTSKVCDLLCTLGTTLVLIDELHNLDPGTRSGAEASGQIKYLSERIPATFVLAGVKIEGTGLFAGRRGGQVAGRYSLITTSPFRYRTAEDQRAWHALVATLEESLRLHARQPGTLVRLGPYLHERTSGMIGSLSHLIGEAALDALLDGTEKITRAGLGAVGLDQAAEEQRSIRLRRRPANSA